MHGRTHTSWCAHNNIDDDIARIPWAIIDHQALPMHPQSFYYLKYCGRILSYEAKGVLFCLGKTVVWCWVIYWCPWHCRMMKESAVMTCTTTTTTHSHYQLEWTLGNGKFSTDDVFNRWFNFLPALTSLVTCTTSHYRLHTINCLQHCRW